MAPDDDDKTSLCLAFILERLRAHRHHQQQQQQQGAPATPLVVGLNGVQGVGKPTLVAALAGALAARGVPAVVCSIDDFYLAREDQEALAAAHPDNPLVQHRGLPGRLGRARCCWLLG